ncbi:MAG: putative metallopeptidase [bacterium]
MKYKIAKDISRQIKILIRSLSLKYIKTKNVHCIRSFDAKTRAYARIWGMAKIFSEVAGLEPHYIIEVNSNRFDKLPEREKMKTLIHELLHIPKTFSGALLSHKGKGRRINDAEVEKIIRNLNK